MFDGKSSTRKVNLGGRNVKPESRQALLARTKAEREARLRQKLEEQSATGIQVWKMSHILHQPLNSLQNRQAVEL